MMMIRVILSVISMSLIPVAYGCAVMTTSHEAAHATADFHVTADLHNDECPD